MSIIEVTVPDIGDFSDVPVITVFVSPGDEVAAEDPLIELESDKATMEVPAPEAGKVVEIKVAEGDKVSEGALILTMETAAAAAPAPKAEAPKSNGTAAPAPAPAPVAKFDGKKGDVHAKLVVLGSGPGGYTAAFRAADLGVETVLIERNETLGGVCLNVGCIPSKALLHAAKVITEAEEMAHFGVKLGKPKIDLDQAPRLEGQRRRQADWRPQRPRQGAQGQGRARHGHLCQPARTMIEVVHEGKTTVVSFDQCVIAAGSEPVQIPFIPHDDERVIDSTGALELRDIPKRLLVLGGGIIGLEMGCVYDALGSRVTVVELMDQIIPAATRISSNL